MNAASTHPARRVKGTIAWIVLALSVPIWCVALVTPWLPIAPAHKSLVATAAIVLGEALFWAAGLALGAHAIVADLTPAALRAAAAEAGDVDHVVVATGIDVRRSLAAHNDQEVDTQLAVALAGPIHVARAFLPRLRAGESIALFGGFGDGTLALPFHFVDVAARAGLASFCAAVNQELAIEGRTERLRYVSPAPARTDAERPFEALWHAMGTPMITPERVADFVLATLLSRNTVAIMGASTRALTRLRAIAPALVDTIVRRRAGALLARAFGDRA